MCAGNARFAESLSIPIGTTSAGPVRDSVVRFCGFVPKGYADVYDLEVSETPEFYANGILVHNCRYGLKTYLGAADKPIEVERQEVFERHQDPQERAMTMLAWDAENERGNYISRMPRG